MSKDRLKYEKPMSFRLKDKNEGLGQGCGIGNSFVGNFCTAGAVVV
jgi:hypothetical protein